MTKSLRHFWSVTLTWMLIAWARSASATTVVIVRPAAPSPDLTETLTRIDGELLSVGFQVPMADRPAPGSPARADWRAWLDQVAAERNAAAIVDMVGDDAVVAVDVWVFKAPGRFEVTRVAREPNSANPAQRLAIRVIEVLRSSLLELDLATRQRAEPPKPKAPTGTVPGGEADLPRGPREEFALEVGAAGLMSLDGVGPAVLPMLSGGWAARPSLVLQAALAGLGTQPTVASPVGRTRVAQAYGLVGGCYRWAPERPWWPFLAVAAGALHTSLGGQAGAGTDAHAVTQWSFLVDGSLGAGMRVHSHYFLTLAAHVQVAAPYVAIHLVDAVAATSGRPNVLLTLTAGTWL